MIKQLTQTQSYIFVFGAIMMVLGAGVYVCAILPFMKALSDPSVTHKIGAILYFIGANCFATMQMLQRYEGGDFVIKRLRRIQLIGDFCFILAAFLIIENAFLLVYPIFLNSGIETYNFYLQYIHNNWVVLLLIAAILEVYTTHRIANLTKKS